MDELLWRAALSDQLKNQATDAEKWSRYYEGTQPLSYMDPELVAELDGRVRSMVINWPRLVVDALEERLDVEGFRFADDSAGDERLWEWWQANDLDEQSQQAHVDALVERRSFVIIGSGDSDTPVITVESAKQVTVALDPRTRAVSAALKAWIDETTGESYATLYLPDVTLFYAGAKDAELEEYDRDEHRLGVVPVVPLVNRPRTMKPGGVSELADVVPISDAACKVATDMMVAAEFHAMPRRYAIGIGPEDFKDENGRDLTRWERIAGRVWTSENHDAKVGQFPEAELKNFHDTINALARLVSSMSGIPVADLGLSSDNPASADAIRSSKERLIKRAERRQRTFGGSWERAMRVAMRIVDGSEADSSSRLETLWADPSTPTKSASADAAIKLYADGKGPVTKRQTREDLGYTQTQIARMEADDARSAERILEGAVESLVGPKPGTVTTPPA